MVELVYTTVRWMLKPPSECRYATTEAVAVARADKVSVATLTRLKLKVRILLWAPKNSCAGSNRDTCA